MKQHITTDQLNELSEEGKKRLREWIELKNYNPHFEGATMMAKGPDLIVTEIMDIGRLIEFLDEQEELQSGDWIRNKDKIDITMHGRELADALWSAVKQILESKITA